MKLRDMVGYEEVRFVDTAPFGSRRSRAAMMVLLPGCFVGRK